MDKRQRLANALGIDTSIIEGDPEAIANAAGVLATPAKLAWALSKWVGDAPKRAQLERQSYAERGFGEALSPPAAKPVGGPGGFDMLMGAPIFRGPKLVKAIEEAQGIRAYHGSPHDFDKFSLSKIGTGEGAQAYGRGLYFAEAEPVARAYRDALTNVNPTVRHYLNLAQGDRALALKNFDRDAKAGAFGFRVHPEEMQAIRARLKEPAGRMYEVNIRANPDKFLDWDKPLPPQLGPLVSKELGTFNGPPESVLATQDRLLRNEVLKDPKSVARIAEEGIPGIKYLDQGSRTAGDGSRNYVLFRDDIIDILRKYGIPIGGVAGAGALSTPDSAEAAP